MALEVSLDQAAANALASYLRGAFTALAGVYVAPNLEVFSDWQELSRRLPKLAVSVIPSGPWDQGDWWAPEVIQRTDLSATSAKYVWECTDVEQPLQLDVWAPTAADRSDLLKKLSDFLRAGPAITLNTLGDPVAPSLLLPMGDGWLGKGDFFFDAPDTSESEDSVGQSEFRATYRGRASLSLQLSSTVARMKTIQLKTKLHEGPTAVAGDLYLITTATAAGVTHTKGP